MSEKLSADELEKLAAAATERPWGVNCHGAFWSEAERCDDGVLYLGATICPADAEIVVYLANHATDIAAVVRENERLKAELAEIVSIVRPADIGPPKSVAAEENS